ncbi:MAG: NAD(P)-dependent alcohol dehydrogenase [Anaerolineales bacterium]
MKAAVYRNYGLPRNVLQIEEVKKPVPTDDEVLVKIHASSLNQYDWHLMTADIFLVRLSMGLFRPKNYIPGADIAGRVEKVGRNVTQFKPGDDVFGDISAISAGGFAEYVAVPETLLVRKPANVTYEEAAAIPMAALTALQGLRDEGQIQPGQKVLIQGSSGGVGSFAVQIAKVFGAEVTAVCSTAMWSSPARWARITSSITPKKTSPKMESNTTSSLPQTDIIRSRTISGR